MRPLLPAALGAVLAALAVGTLFLPWYGSSLGGGLSLDLTAWQAFAGADVILLLLGVAVAGLGFFLAVSGSSDLPSSIVRGAAEAGGVAATAMAALILVKLLFPPRGELVDLDLRFGCVLALVCTIGAGSAFWVIRLRPGSEA